MHILWRTFSVSTLALLSLVGTLLGGQAAEATHIGLRDRGRTFVQYCPSPIQQTNLHHCTITDYFSHEIPDARARLTGTKKFVLHATLNMDTVLRAPETGITPNCTAGETVRIPIDAGGELIGAGSAFFDSPPIHFLPNGLLRAITAGVPRICPTDREGNLNFTAEECKQFDSPVEATWADSWTYNRLTQFKTGGGVECSSNAAGTLATCVVAPGTNSDISANLTRTLNDPKWLYNGAPGKSTLIENGLKPPYGKMVSKVVFHCAEGQLPNLLVESASFTPLVPVHTESIDVQGRVRNSALGNAGASVTRLQFDSNLDGTWDTGPFDVSTAALSSGRIENAAWQAIWQPPAGAQRLQVCADATNVVKETDETDNCYVRIFSVKRPVISCSPSTPTVALDSPVTFSASGGGSRESFYRWRAGEAVPADGVGSAFTTSFATVGVKQVGLIEHYYDVNGDGQATPADLQDVVAHLNDTLPGSGGLWQNQANRYDVDGDGQAGALDVQFLSDFIIEQGGAPLRTGYCTVTVTNTPVTVTTAPVPPGLTCPAKAPWYDVNGDGQVTRADSDELTAALNNRTTTLPGTGGAWQNQLNRIDVDGDGVAAPTDVRLIVNYINDGGNPALPVCATPTPRPTPIVTPTPTPTPTPAPGGGPFRPGPVREDE